MVWLSVKEEWKKVYRALNPFDLEFIGAHEFYIMDKIAGRLPEEETSQMYLFLSTESGAYRSTVIVSREKYIHARVGKSYGICGVVKNIRHDDIILISEKTDAHKAITQVVWKAWGKMFFILFALCLFICSIMILIYPILKAYSNK